MFAKSTVAAVTRPLRTKADKKLWRWADTVYKPRSGSGWPSNLFRAHEDSCTIIDALEQTRRHTKSLLPLVGALRRFWGSGRAPGQLPEVPTVLANWNSAGEFLDGAEAAYGSVLRAMLSGEPQLSQLRPALGDSVWQQLGASTQAESASNGPRRAVVEHISVRLVDLDGPESLRSLREGHSPWAHATNPRLRGYFQDDILHGSRLELRFAAVSQVRRPGPENSGDRWFLRLDGLVLTTDFDLVKGIRAPFLVTAFEELGATEAV